MDNSIYLKPVEKKHVKTKISSEKLTYYSNWKAPINSKANKKHPQNISDNVWLWLFDQKDAIPYKTAIKIRKSSLYWPQN